jgi:hypothetical protein
MGLRRACQLGWLVVAMLVAPERSAWANAKPPAREVLVVAAAVEDRPEAQYLWAAEMAASRLKGSTRVLPGGLAEALRYARENPGAVQGIIEVMIDVYSWKEEVRISCLDPAGRTVWKEKAVMNNGGSEEALARKMFERALKKAERRGACQG